MAVQPIQPEGTAVVTPPSPTTTPVPTLSFGNGATFDQSGKALNTQAQADLKALGVTGGSYTGYVSPVTTSSPFETKVNNLGNSIQGGLSNPPITPIPANPAGSYNPSYDPSADPKVAAEITASNQALIDRQKALQEERNAALSSLTEQFGRDKTALTETQKKETGSTNRNLLYLQQGGQSASAQAYLNDLEVSHQREMDNFTAKYNNALQLAKNAYNEKDFELAQAQVKNANDIKAAAQKRNQDFLDYTIKINNEIRQEQQFQYQREKDLQSVRKDARDYATTQGITQPFYELGGEVFSTKDGKWFDPSNPKEFIDAGGKPDYSNVFIVKPNDNKQYAGGDLGEFQYLVDTGEYQPGQFMDFLHAKANQRERIARAGATTNISYADQEKAKEADATARYGAKLGEQVGADGYVSPEVWKAGYRSWVSEGLDGKLYSDKFQGFINNGANYIDNYGLK